jgi:hypothetical protein
MNIGIRVIHCLPNRQQFSVSRGKYQRPSEMETILAD